MICPTFSFIEQLQEAISAMQHIEHHKGRGGSKEKSSAFFGPVMRDKGPMSMPDLIQLTGKTHGCINNAMHDTLIKRELVRKVWIEGHVHWEWIGE